jgi:methyltransferase (TIGR00027 family)
MAERAPHHTQQDDLPSRTSILVAAARAFGSRDPDPGVRNPDHLADKLIGPDELDLIRDQPLSQGLKQDYAEASQNPAIAGFVSLMILRTRFIDQAMQRAVANGASQIIILGAGFDSRAYRFTDLLQHCQLFEVDTENTQQYKRRRVHATLGDPPPNLTYVSVDFAKDNLSTALTAHGFRNGAKTFYIWEGVCMYLPEKSVRETLQMVASHSAPGSSLVLDYTSSLGIEISKQIPQGPVAVAASWGEPWIFGVPGTNGADFFRELGFDPGVPVSMNNPEVIKRFAVRSDGTTYAGHVMARMRAEAQAQAEAGTAPPIPAHVLDAQKAIAAAGGTYWLAELTVPSTSHAPTVN